MRIEAIADIHVGLESTGFYKERFRKVSTRADVLVIAGDLTQTGSMEEAEILRDELSVLTVPCVCVLGNHDWAADQQQKITQVLASNQIFVLQGTNKIIEGVGFAGVKGFIGGFGDKLLPDWGEPLIRQVVKHTRDEAAALETALALMDAPKKVVVMHYSPIKGTVVGEDPEIFPFLGSSYYEDIINRMGVLASFHGHAHHGSFEGKTEKGIPVFNVSEQVLAKSKKEFFIFEV